MGAFKQTTPKSSLSESALDFLKKARNTFINNKLCVQHEETILFLFYLHSTHCFTLSIKHSPKFINALSERLALKSNRLYKRAQLWIMRTN